MINLVVEINWDKAPSWAKYFTADSDGFYFWENKPNLEIVIGKYTYTTTGGRVHKEYFEFEPIICERDK